MRRYNKWAARPNGVPEDPLRCIVEVATGGRSVLTHQCYRKRGYGPNCEYCNQHGKMLMEGRYINIPRKE